MIQNFAGRNPVTLKQVQYLKLMIYVREEGVEGVEKKRGF